MTERNSFRFHNAVIFKLTRQGKVIEVSLKTLDSNTQPQFTEIVYKWKKFKIMFTLHRNDRPTEITQECDMYQSILNNKTIFELISLNKMYSV